MSVDMWTARLHAEAFADDPPCKNCHCPAEDHETEFGRPCNNCDDCPDGYEPIDPRDLERDEPYEED